MEEVLVPSNHFILDFFFFAVLIVCRGKITGL